MNHRRRSLRDRLSAAGSALANSDLGRFQAAVLALLFACVWCVIGLVAGYLLSLFVFSLSPSNAAGSWPETLMFTATAVICAGYGAVRGWRLYQSFSESLED
jgi:hypothetical protein